MTMKEKQFARYVKNQRDEYRKLRRGNCPLIDNFIGDMIQKEVFMRADGEWNVLSKEDATILALVTAIENANKQNAQTFDNDNSAGKSSAENKDGAPSRRKKKNKFEKSDYVTPAWKFVNESNVKEKIVEGKTYYWCKRCNHGCKTHTLI